MIRSRWTALAVAFAMAALAVAGAFAGSRAIAQSALDAPDAPEQDTPVDGRFSTENACYIRLPDMPQVRYGGFGGFNPETGVLTYAGGAEKKSEDNTYAYFNLYSMKLEKNADGSLPAWKELPYSSGVGYTRDADKGCREMTSVMLSPSRWLSVLGKDGCDNGAFDTGSKKGGDLKEIQIGDAATQQQVKWVTNSGAQRLIGDLEAEKGKLVRLFATHDTKRNRVVFGQGTFDDAIEQESQNEVYAARPVGSKWQISELRTSGAAPSRRFSTCATYVEQEDKGVDGILVLGGQEGGQTGTTSYKEVWWLDFASSANGTWVEITDLFSNMDAIGYRRGGACAYDPDTMQFYSWMGRASSSIPDGASRSAGMWRTDLSMLSEAVAGNATLEWERLAKDDQGDKIHGRRLIPSVYDFTNKRFFVLGGRNDNEASTAALKDTWVIYPDVTGSECDNLDPYAAVEPTETPETPTPDTPTPGGPSPTPGGTDTPTPVTPVPTAVPGAEQCDGLDTQVPSAVIANALSNPDTIAGWGELCNPNVDPSPWNTLRTYLSLQNPGAAYHPLYNSVVFRCGCR